MPLYPIIQQTKCLGSSSLIGVLGPVSEDMFLDIGSKGISQNTTAQLHMCFILSELHQVQYQTRTPTNQGIACFWTPGPQLWCPLELKNIHYKMYRYLVFKDTFPVVLSRFFIWFVLPWFWLGHWFSQLRDLQFNTFDSRQPLVPISNSNFWLFRF